MHLELFDFVLDTWLFLQFTKLLTSINPELKDPKLLSIDIG